VTTLLRLESPAAGIVPVGGAWVLDVSTWDEYGYAVPAVSPSVSITLPDGSTTVPVPVGDGSGGWAITVLPVQSGRYVAHVSTVDDAVDAAVYVLGPTTASGMPKVSDVAVYLGSAAGNWSTDDLQDALDAERAAQRARCGERPYYPPDLRQALLRRIQRNLALRRLPLAVQDSEGGSTVLPGRDPEVRRLEGPWRKLVVG
jgi:hypothetical protein